MALQEKINTLRERVKHAATWEDVNSILELVDDVNHDVADIVEGFEAVTESRDHWKAIAYRAEQETQTVAGELRAMRDAAYDHQRADDNGMPQGR